MPPIGLLLGNVDFSNLFITLKEGGKAAGPYASLAAAKAAGAVTLNLGVFINTIISFRHHRLCGVPGDQGHQPNEAGKGGAAGRPTTRECPYLPVHHPPQGHPLPPLHLGVSPGLRLGLDCICSWRRAPEGATALAPRALT